MADVPYHWGENKIVVEGPQSSHGGFGLLLSVLLCFSVKSTEH